MGLAVSGGSDAGLIPNRLGSEDGSGIKASVSASCGLRGCLAPQAILAMLGISRLMECNHERDNDGVQSVGHTKLAIDDKADRQSKAKV